MATAEDGVERTFDQLSREQIEIYARELQQHARNERRLRRELEKRNQELEQRVREVTALNKLFQRHLNERFAVVEAYRRLLEELVRLSGETSALMEWAQSQPVPDLEDAPGLGSDGDAASMHE